MPENSHHASVPKDLALFLSRIKRDFGGLLAPKREISIARAPARLDIMGGVGDYSGSLVLEGTLQEATIVAVQKRTDRRILLKSLGVETEGMQNLVELYLDDFYHNGQLKSVAELQSQLKQNPRSRWIAYVVGFFPLLIQEGVAADFSVGANIAIKSDIPLGSGVASSAALEVATLLALQHAFSLQIKPEDLPLLCQKVENHLVGAPCGVMDQLTSALGHKDKLLAIRCQPAEIIDSIPCPKGYQFAGIDSGVKHSVSGSHYADARTATFMGRKMCLQSAQKEAIAGDIPYGGYLANINPQTWQETLKKKIPGRMRGIDFINRYGSHDDPATQIDPDKIYSLRRCTEHPILENARVGEFIRLLQTQSLGEEQIIQAGELMVESHLSYSQNCRLGSKETDLLVDLVLHQGPKNGLYGAKISGGGSGGTVAVLLANGQENLLKNIVSLYIDTTKLPATLFFQSSPGALQLGVIKTQFE
ncbi:MAG TPA: GHMP kinase [bacterium]|nr:GHMP kinase [bacterium]HOX85415.1 GHMP kinase [bacterium]HPG44574.1 GHMP kinase [bacterium]HPM97132.1 GHMP kinase [bacterium]